MTFYITGVNNQSDSQVDFQNPASSSDNMKVPPKSTMPCDPPVLVPHVMYNPPEEISVSTEIGVFYLRDWNGQLLSMLVNQGEVPLAPPPDSEELQLVVKATGGIAVLPQ